jgi:hypothetical protein
VDLEGHQVFEAFKALFGVENGLGGARNGHGGWISYCKPSYSAGCFLFVAFFATAY